MLLYIDSQGALVGSSIGISWGKKRRMFSARDSEMYLVPTR